MDSHSRSIAKAISYRVLGSATTMFVFFVLSRDLTLSIGAGIVDSLVKTGLYFIHERMWNHIPFGRQKRPEYEI